ncbi:hypothetical protein C8R47DRAFT_645132 [Mycena vitilis]|nr:hypothetical protein C8R47DRAFT_645132 [Mycena vitilis]
MAQFGYLRRWYGSRSSRRLPLLERLEIGGDIDLLGDIFKVAPKLTHVSLAARGEPSSVPWKQLREVIHEAGDCAGELPFAILQHCPRKCAFAIRDLRVTHLEVPIPVLPPVMSDIQRLEWELTDLDNKEHSHQVVGGLLGRLTLPCLQALTLTSRFDDAPLFWPRDDPLPFASRSLFHQKLTRLCLHGMVITADELVESLLGMHVLKELFIQDVLLQDHVLITDDVLRRLSCTSGATFPIPRLSTFRFASGHHFDDYASLHLVESRLVSGRTNVGPFKVVIHWPRENAMDDWASPCLFH